jgi:hypothetical protein
MSAVRVAKSVSPEPSALDADVQAMQDVLYDILAMGIDPDQQDVPSAEIERFLHEHARAPKSLQEFRAFFAAQGLSVRARSASESAGLQLPPIERPDEGAAVLRLAPEPAPAAEAEPDTAAHSIAAMTAPGVTVAPSGGRELRRLGLWAAAGCTAALLGAVLFYGYASINDLRDRLDRANQRADQEHQVVERLRDHATELESSVATTSELVQRVDQKSDMVLNTLLPLVRPPQKHR